VKDKQHIMVSQPHIVKEYHKFMGGVDLHDMLVALYRTNIRAKRFYLGIIFHLIDICVVNGWLLYRRHLALAGESKYSTLADFRSSIAHALLTAGKTVSKKRGRPAADDNAVVCSRTAKRAHFVKPVDDARYNSFGHWPEHSLQKYRCALCKVVKSRVRCTKCDVALCLTNNKNHFDAYHKH